MKRGIIKRFLAIAFSLFAAVSVNGQSAERQVRFYVFSEKGVPLENVSIVFEGGETILTDSSGHTQAGISVSSLRINLVYNDATIATMDIDLSDEYDQELIITVDTEKITAYLMEDEGQVKIADLKKDRAAVDASAPTGTLSGTVLQVESEREVAGATVIFRGVELETVSDENGVFSVEVPEGTYSLSVIHPQFSTRTVNEISVLAGTTQEITVALTPSAITLDAVRVFASAEVRVQGGVATLIEETKNSGVMLNLIGSEQISKSGDGDAASALKRVTGLTIIDGKYVYVRGMGDRYSSSYLNGARIPSPEVGNRVVPLDLFPTSVIEAMAVQKTYSPDLYGEFGGGAVQLRTTGIPDDRYKRRLRQTYSLSLGYDMDVSLGELLVSTNSGIPFTGFDDGSRDLPAEIEDRVVQGGSLTEPGFSPDQIAEIGRRIPDLIAPRSQTIPLDISGSFSLRDKIDFEKSRTSFGWNFSGLYRNDWDSDQKTLKDFEYSGDQRVVYYDYDSIATMNNIDMGSLLNLEYKNARKLNIESTTLAIHTSENSAHYYEGYKKDMETIQVTDMSWIEQTLLNQQLRGIVELEFLNYSLLDASYSFSYAGHREPDHYKYMYQEDPAAAGGYSIKASAQSIGLVWGKVDDFIHDGSVHLEIPFRLFRKNEVNDYADIGFQFIRQDRSAAIRRFGYIPATAVSGSIEEVLDDDNIGTTVDFLEFTKKFDSYTGSHTVAAGYVDLDIMLARWLRLTGGLRYEYSNQTIETYDFENQDRFLTESLVYHDFLPSVNLNFPFDASQQLRFGVSRTVNRPDLKEISYVPTYGIEGQPITLGYPGLAEAEIWNIDARYEHYLTENENISFGAFYKNFRNPIEAAFLPGESNYSVYTNVPQAYNLGAELEWRLSLRYVSDALRWFIKTTRPSAAARRILGSTAGVFRDITASGNLSYIQSRVVFDGQSTVVFRNTSYSQTNTSTERALQGQSPWIVNLSLGYKNSVSWSVDRKTHTSCNLNYNVMGPRITQVGVDGTPDHYEQPFHQLDLVIKHSFNEVFSMGIKAVNLLDLPAVTTLDNEEITRYRKGRSFSLSATLEL